MSDSLVAKIRADQLQARKVKDTVASNLLTTLLGEALAVGKNAGNREPNESEVIQVVKKFLKSNVEALGSLEKAGRDTSDLEQEKRILETYLPAQLSEADLTKIITGYIEKLEEKSPKQMGIIMSQLKSNYDGQYDGKQASQLVRAALS